MARAIALLPMEKIHFLPSSFTFLIVVAVIFSVFSIVTFLCGKEQKTVRLGGKNSKALSSKALLIARMMSWKKVQDGGEADDEEDDGAVWKKTIIKGEKCGPLDFSGRILYDSKGNLLLE